MLCSGVRTVAMLLFHNDLVRLALAEFHWQWLKIHDACNWQLPFFLYLDGAHNIGSCPCQELQYLSSPSAPPRLPPPSTQQCRVFLVKIATRNLDIVKPILYWTNPTVREGMSALFAVNPALILTFSIVDNKVHTRTYLHALPLRSNYLSLFYW